jgi:hypothetical protein
MNKIHSNVLHFSLRRPLIHPKLSAESQFLYGRVSVMEPTARLLMVASEQGYLWSSFSHQPLLLQEFHAWF